MITRENQEFLLNWLHIDATKYTKEQLNIILDNIIKLIQEEIEKKRNHIIEMKLELMNINEEIIEE